MLLCILSVRELKGVTCVNQKNKKGLVVIAFLEGPCNEFKLV